MFNDDVLARCPECGSPDTVITAEKAACNACGFEEPSMPEGGVSDGMQELVADTQKMARFRDVLQRWDFAGFQSLIAATQPLTNLHASHLHRMEQ